jgi:aspartate racemase
MHRVADQLAAAVEIPFVHIADTTAEAVRAAGLSVVVPGAEDRRLVHKVIYREHCQGIVREDSRQARRVIAALVERGPRASCWAAPSSTC